MKTLINKVVGRLGYTFAKRYDLATVLKRCNPETILDIGANTGQFLREALTAVPSAMFFSFEPNPEAFRVLHSRFGHQDRVTLYNFALGSASTRNTLNISKFSPSSSLLPIADRHLAEFPDTHSIGTIEVDVKTLDDVCCGLQLKGPILCKLDVQGYELEVMRGAGDSLKILRYLIIETSFVELYDGSPLFASIYGELTARGFSLQEILEVSRSPTTGESLYADLLFVRR
jgi:FkbM family methyltransferase